jgi:glycine/serine hydroxymethyltransferase
MAKVLGLKQLLQKKYVLLEGLDAKFKNSFGDLVDAFIMIVWGLSGHGKSNLMMEFLLEMMKYGRVLYVGLEEGHSATMQKLANRHLQEQHAGIIKFADHTMTYDELFRQLKKKKSPKFIVVDSLQYMNISYEQYKALKEDFRKKVFIFISHASGKMPDGRTADKIRYDADIKIRVEGFIAFIASRFGGNKNFVIWEEGAKKYWGTSFKKHVNR